MKYEYYASNNNGKDDYGLKCVNEKCEGLICKEFKVKFPPQCQECQPGIESVMIPRPIFYNPNYRACGKLSGKVAIVTGGDSGIGRAVSVTYAMEGAKVVIVYLNEHGDAEETKKCIESLGGYCMLISGDLKDPNFCKSVIDNTINKLGKIDILVNNAGMQFYQKSLLGISDEQFDCTMKTNIYSMFYLTKNALNCMAPGASIINVTSITTFAGEPELIDYVTSKGAIVGFTRALAANLADKNIRVNAVSPGVFWTPLQPACWPKEKIPTLGSDCPMGRAGNTYEIAPIFVYLACEDSSYVTGQVMHINGGQYMG